MEVVLYIREDHSSVPEMVILGDVYSFFFDCACTYVVSGFLLSTLKQMSLPPPKYLLFAPALSPQNCLASNSQQMVMISYPPGCHHNYHIVNTQNSVLTRQGKIINLVGLS